LIRNVIRKQFIEAGVPWTYEQPKSDEANPRHKAPKKPKWIRNKSVRLSEIKSLVDKNDQLVNEYRQEFLNNRKYKGASRFVKEFVPSWLSYLRTTGYKTVQNDEEGNPAAKTNPGQPRKKNAAT
jgi:hypothetical protein